MTFILGDFWFRALLGLVVHIPQKRNSIKNGPAVQNKVVFCYIHVFSFCKKRHVQDCTKMLLSLVLVVTYYYLFSAPLVYLGRLCAWANAMLSSVYILKCTNLAEKGPLGPSLDQIHRVGTHEVPILHPVANFDRTWLIYEVFLNCLALLDLYWPHFGPTLSQYQVSVGALGWPSGPVRDIWAHESHTWRQALKDCSMACTLATWHE